jgi:hypothetical protein
MEACRRVPLFPRPAVVARGSRVDALTSSSSSMPALSLPPWAFPLGSSGVHDGRLERAVREPVAAVSPGAPLQ